MKSEQEINLARQAVEFRLDELTTDSNLIGMLRQHLGDQLNSPRGIPNGAIEVIELRAMIRFAEHILKESDNDRIAELITKGRERLSYAQKYPLLAQGFDLPTSVPNSPMRKRRGGISGGG